MNQGFLDEVRSQFFLKGLLPDRVDHFTVGKYRFFLIYSFQVGGDQAGHPTAAMDDVGRPSELLNRLQRSFAKENSTEIVVVKPFVLLVVENSFSLEQLFVIQEIYLQTRTR